MQAFADHGEVEGDQVTTKYAEAQQVMDDLAKVGIDYDDVIETLEREGVEKFVASWDELVETVKGQLEVAEVSETLEVAATGAAAEAIRTHVPGLVEDGFAGQAVRPGRDAVGSRRPRRSPPSGSPGSGCPAPRGSWSARSPRCAASSQDAGVDHVVLCGMGGSSLAPEVICASYGVELTVLDSSSPDQVREALADRLDRTVVVVSSKSGLHGGDRLPAPRLRAGVHRRRHRPGRADRRSSPTRAARWTSSPARPATASSTPTPTWAAATAR